MADEVSTNISRDKTLKTDATAISESLRAARRSDALLQDFPGKIPATLEAAYDIQSLSIEAWPDDVKGWKVGGVPPAFLDRFDAPRLVGPVFSKTVRQAPEHSSIDVPAYQGFAAVEAEWVFELGDCSHLPDADLSEQDAISAIRAAYIGVELASSPIVDINSYGPAVIISDFGNNHGVIVGQRVEDWSSEALSRVEASVSINGEVVGRGRARPELDGPLGAVTFLIEHLKARGASDLSGVLISSGAITGVHDARIGASSVVAFEGIGEISLNIAPIA